MIYAIGDIHGQLGQLEQALALIDADGGPDARIVFLGDYTDRGADSARVVGLLADGIAAGRNWTAIMGNHDRLFTRFIRHGTVDDDAILSGKGWLHPALGGATTLASYGVQAAVADEGPVNTDALAALVTAAREQVPDAHLQFLESRPLMHCEAGLVFVHAGIRPGIPFDAQVEDDLLWIRTGWLDDTRDHGALVVHGHTALDAPQHHGNRVNMDGGAGYGRPLVPAVFEDGQAWTLTPTGRIALA